MYMLTAFKGKDEDIPLGQYVPEGRLKESVCFVQCGIKTEGRGKGD